MSMSRQVASSLCLLQVAAAAVSFASIGDWGGAGINGGDYHKTSELAVAKQLGKTAGELDVKFVINTGDNFYYCGVQNITDEQFKVDFEDVFTDKSLNVPWYGILGNHDYAYDPSSQFNYKSPNNDRWQLPSYYYTKRVLLGGSQYASFLFVDTSPCIASYRADDPKGWDPCSGAYGECLDTDGKCHFHEHIIAQDCSVQYAWFKKALEAVDADDWLFVVGHHEADQINVEDFSALMLESKMRLYLNGHTHALKHYQLDSKKDMDFFTTGAGCMVHTEDQEVCTTALCAVQPTHHAKELFYKKVSGFTVHTFAEDFSTLTTKVIDTDGKVIYSFVTNKNAGSAGLVV